MYGWVCLCGCVGVFVWVGVGVGVWVCVWGVGCVHVCGCDVDESVQLFYSVWHVICL